MALKPTAANTGGLPPEYSKIGTDVKNCRIHVAGARMDDQGSIQFTALYFWNGPAHQQWLDEGGSSWRGPIPQPFGLNVLPFRTENYSIVGDPDLGVKQQCYNYLLTLPQFSGSFE